MQNCSYLKYSLSVTSQTSARAFYLSLSLCLLLFLNNSILASVHHFNSYKWTENLLYTFPRELRCQTHLTHLWILPYRINVIKSIIWILRGQYINTVKWFLFGCFVYWSASQMITSKSWFISMRPKTGWTADNNNRCYDSRTSLKNHATWF